MFAVVFGAVHNFATGVSNSVLHFAFESVASFLQVEKYFKMQ